MNKEGRSWSSGVAAGIYNPFNFRRASPLPHAKSASPIASEFYARIEKICEGEFHSSKSIVRVFSDAQERELWTKYVAQPDAKFASSAIVNDLYDDKIKMPFGSGLVTGGGVVNTGALMFHVKAFFEQQNLYREEWFDTDKLEYSDEAVCYDQRITAKNIIFCEGHLAPGNALFPHIPVVPTKGEILHVHIPGLNATEVINGSVYLSPIGNDLYICGATFNPGRSDEQTTEAGKNELIEKLESLVNIPFRVESHFAGVRPAGRDRKPVIGRSRNHRNLSIFNGFGSKAVLMSPFLAQMLADHLETGADLLPEVNIARFKVY